MNNKALTANNTTAMAVVAPMSEVIELVKLYQQAVDASGRIFFDQRFDQKKFEAAILKRTEKYLDLLLSKCVSQIGSARELWDRASTDESSYALAIKENVVAAMGTELLVGDRYGFSGELTEIGKEVFPNLDELTDLGYEAFKSEKNKSLIRCFVLGAHNGKEKNPFLGCSKIFKLQAWSTISQNGSINVDESNSDGPDLEAWDVFSGIRSFIQDAPTDHHHLAVIHQLVSNLDPKNFWLGKDFDVDDFINKWLSEESRWPKDDEEDSFNRRWDATDLSLNQEMIGLLIAKFQPEFQDKVKFKNVKEARESTHIPSKAAFFGRLSPSTLNDTLNDGILERSWLFFALQNPYLYSNSKAVSAVEEYLDDDSLLSGVFKKQKQQHQSRRQEPTQLISSVSQQEEDMDTVISMLSKIRSDLDHLKEAFVQLKDKWKTYKWWLVILALIIFFKQ
jgi:hypothetical protein